MSDLTHLDERGAARMVDVSAKEPSEREASAEAVIVLSEEAYAAVLAGDAPKGDVLAAARIAGIMAAKKAPELIPLCHVIPLSKAEIAFEMQEERHAIRIVASAKTVARTGVEMEVLTAAAVAALTVYDMVKALDKSAVVEFVRLLTKSGGKSGSFTAPAPRAARKNAPGPTARRRAAPSVLMGEVVGSHPQAGISSPREAFRAFMLGHHLRATEWAKQAGVPAAEIYAFLTGRIPALSAGVAEKLAKAARVRVEDMFR